MTDEELKEKLQKSLDDAAVGRNESFDTFFSTFTLIMKGDEYRLKNDRDNAEKCYLDASVKFKSNHLKGLAYFKLAQLYYNFEKPDALYATIYLKLALSNGYMKSSFYLANLYEQCKDIDGIEYNVDEIIRLYRLYLENAEDEYSKDLALERLKDCEQIKLELK